MEDGPQLTQVRQAHRFDEEALAAFLGDRLGRLPRSLEIRQFEGGQSNPTFLISSGERRWVLRKKPPGELLRSAHQVEREYRVMRALRDTKVPVPRMDVLCEDDSILGTPFFLMEYVDGRILPESHLPTLDKGARRALFLDLIRVLAHLHMVDPAAVGLEDFGRAGNYCSRQISRWGGQYEASKTADIGAMEALIEWLPKNVPESDQTRVVHGDYRVGNALVHPAEPRVLAVLDWELSTLGDPLADLAYFCQLYHGMGAAGAGLAESELVASGIPSEEETLEHYCRYTGRSSIEDWRFYMVFVMFRSAAIAQGVYKRGLDGNASSQRAREFGEQVRIIADTAWSLAQS